MGSNPTRCARAPGAFAPGAFRCGGALLLSGCGDGELPLTKLELEQEQRIEELEAELEQAEARLAEAAEALAGAGEGAEYSLENMIRVEPEFSQAVVNCPEGILVSPVEPQLKCGHPMENGYVEVVAKCRVKLSSELAAEGGREQV